MSSASQMRVEKAKRHKNHSKDNLKSMTKKKMHQTKLSFPNKTTLHSDIEAKVSKGSKQEAE